jgi:hypothetical protein
MAQFAVANGAPVEENILRFCTFSPDVMATLGPSNDRGLNYPPFIDGARANFPSSFNTWLHAVCESRPTLPRNLDEMIDWIDNCTYEEQVINRDQLRQMIPSTLCGEHMNSFFLTQSESDLKTLHVPLMFLFLIKRNQYNGAERTVFALTFAVIPLDDDPNNPNPLLEGKYIFNIDGVCGEPGSCPLYAFLLYKTMFEYIFNYANIANPNTIREMVIILAALILPLAGYIRAGFGPATSAGINPIYRDFAQNNFKEYVDGFDDYIYWLQAELNKLPDRDPRKVKLLNTLAETVDLKQNTTTTILVRSTSLRVPPAHDDIINVNMLNSLVMNPDQITNVLAPVVNPDLIPVLNNLSSQSESDSTLYDSYTRSDSQLSYKEYRREQDAPMDESMPNAPMDESMPNAPMDESMPLTQSFHSVGSNNNLNILTGVTNAPLATTSAAAAAAVAAAVTEYRIDNFISDLYFDVLLKEERRRRESFALGRGEPKEVKKVNKPRKAKENIKQENRKHIQEIGKYINSITNVEKLKKLAQGILVKDTMGNVITDLNNIPENQQLNILKRAIMMQVESSPQYRDEFRRNPRIGGTTKKRRNKRSGRKTRKTTKNQRNNKTKNRKRYRQKSKRNR